MSFFGQKFGQNFGFGGGGLALQSNPPSALGWTWASGISFFKNGSIYSSSFDITSLKPAVTTTYYVDPTGGNDGNSGLTRALALKSLSVAIAKANVDQIIIINLTADIVVRSTLGWGAAAAPNRSFSVINETPQFRYINAGASGTVNNWTVNGTFPAVYQNARSSAGIGVVDCRLKAWPFRLDVAGTGYAVNDTVTLPNGAILKVLAIDGSGGIITYSYNLKPTSQVTGTMTQSATSGAGTGAQWVSITNAPAMFYVANKVASIAAVNAAPGSFFDDGTNVYYQPPDGAVLTGSQPKIVISVATDTLRMGSFSNLTIYLQDIDIVGGQRCFYASMASTNTGSRYALNHCSFQGAGTDNGMSILCTSTIYAKDCGAYFNTGDGYSFHSFEADGTTTGTSPKSFLDSCIGQGNGTTGSAGTSDNDFTAHDDSDNILLNCIACGSADRVMAYVNKCRSWIMGGFCGAAAEVAASKESISVQSTAKMFIDGIRVMPAASATEKYGITSGAFLYYRNMSPVPTTSGAGTIAAY